MNPPVGTVFRGEHSNKYVEAVGARAREQAQEQLETGSSAEEIMSWDCFARYQGFNELLRGHASLWMLNKRMHRWISDDK